jgi:hypothetical protein
VTGQKIIFLYFRIGDHRSDLECIRSEMDGSRIRNVSSESEIHPEGGRRRPDGTYLSSVFH